MDCLLYLIFILGTWFYSFLVYLHFHYAWFVPSHKYAEHVKHLNEIQSEYDYIIVGAGTAGCVIAHRLSQNTSLKILLLEAGPAGGPILDVPAAIPLLQLSEVDWGYKTTSQEHSAKALNDHKSNWPRGKLVGGSGRLNNMLYVRGHPQDYVNWFAKDDRKVNDFQELEKFLKYYWKRSESQMGRFKHDSDLHGTSGPLAASDMPFRTQLSAQFELASKELNITKRDYNIHYTGFDLPQLNLQNGARYSTGHFLLDQLQNKPNLHLVTLTEVIKINFVHKYEAASVVAVSYANERMRTLHARQGIIVSAGAINTPKLLQLSGIGDPKHLESLGVETNVKLPEVGMNLQDHISSGMDLITLNTSLELNPYSLINPLTIFNYIWNGKGALGTAQCEAIIISHSDCLSRVKAQDFQSCEERNKLNAPDMQIMVLPLGMTTDFGAHLYRILGFNRTIYDEHYAQLHGTPTALFLPLVLHPKSVGYVRINSASPWEAPIINPNYLSHPDDIETLLKGMRFVQALVETSALQQLGAALDARPFPSCRQHLFDSDDYWKCYIRHVTLTIYHPVGTAALGTVLDYNFKVKGTNKLFVVDASALPDLSSGNPNAVVVVAAEIASDLIKQELNLSRGRCHINEVFINKHSTSIFT